MKYIMILCSLFWVFTTQAMELKATVNDTPISDLDIQSWSALLKMQQPQKYDFMEAEQLQKEALDAVIESVIKRQTALAAHKQVNQNEIDDAKAHLEEQNQMPPGSLAELLKKNGVSEKVLNQQIESDLLWLQYLRENATDLKISDLAVEKRYQAFRKDLDKQGIKGDNLTLWEMAQGVFPENVDVSTTMSSKSCDAFLEHIKIGPYPESAQRGWTDPALFPKEMKELLQDVAVGETVGPLRTPQGILVMMKCDVRTQQVMPSKEQLKMQMEMEQLDLLSRRLLAEATRRSIIEKKDK